MKKLKNATGHTKKEEIKMDEKWISLNAFMKMRKIGYETAMDLIKNNEVEFQKTSGGRYKIKVGGDTVSRELYDQEREKRIQAETRLQLVLKIAGEGVRTND